MPTAVLPLAAESEPKRRRFTRAEVYRLLDEGFFNGERFELIDGDLIDKMGQKAPHAQGIRRVTKWLVSVFGIERIQIQLPMQVGADDQEFNEPEPDLIVLTDEAHDFSRRHPRGDETVLVIEIADSSLRQDAVRKRQLYARAGVPEYWVLNVAHRELIVHTDLRDGRYHDVRALSEGAAVSFSGQADVMVAVDSLLPAL